MRHIWRFVLRWWWAFLAGLATVVGIVLGGFVACSRRNTTIHPTTPPTLTFKERAEQQVEHIRLEGEVEKARVTARADVYSEQLDQIEETGKDDPAEARRQLARFLAQNL